MDKLLELRKREKERQKRIQELEKQINKLKEILESPLEAEDQEKLDAELVSPTKITKGLIVESPQHNARKKHEKLKAELSGLDYQRRQDYDAEAAVRRQYEGYQHEYVRLV
jgi:hypothetical protein